MNGTVILHILPILEILIWNLFTTDKCCRRTYSPAKTVSFLSLFTAVAVLSILLFSEMLTISVGNGRFMLMGFVYLIPLKILYNVKLSHLFTIMCTCWTYTLGVLILSTQISGLIAADNIFLLLIVENLIFLATSPLFYGRIVTKYRFVIDNLLSYRKRWYRYIFFNNCLHFFVLAVLSLIFLGKKASLQNIVFLLCLFAAIYLSYFILYRLLLDSIRVKQLEEATLYDELTALGNRSHLQNDLHDRLHSHQTFSVLFMDLNHFKQVNDRLSHAKGDEYLKQFARHSSNILKRYGTVYRFGGDEFVAVCPETVPPWIIDKLEKCSQWDPSSPCPFYGVSIGSVVCRPPHRNAEQILHQADTVMYHNKLRKNSAI